MKIEAIKIDGVEYVVKRNDKYDILCHICAFKDCPPNRGICALCLNLIPGDKYFVRKDKANE